MTTLSEPLRINENERIRQAVLEQLARQWSQFHGTKQPPVILRAEVRVEGLDAFTWLCAQPPKSRGYWSDRKNRFQMAGSGGADVITGESTVDYHQLMDTLHQRLATARGTPRYFGGLRFSMDGRPENAWSPFKAYRFILPRFEVVTRDGVTIFACNMLSHENMDGIIDALGPLSFPESKAVPAVPRAKRRTNLPDRRQWCQAVQSALDAFQPNVYEKVVLARKVTFEFDAPLDAAALLKALKQNTSHCFHFLFQPDPQSGFLGASPERLYRRDKEVIRTEAIAGSRPRGASRKEDEDLTAALLASEKDTREHAYVVKEIHRTLSDYCSLLVADKQPQALKLKRCQHLLTGFKGRLKHDVKDADLLKSLHPTPAVGGFPRDRALQDIARLEPFDRGWYAGPVGWIEKDAAQFVVGIRSGLTEGSRLHLYSGAGIVDGSVPQEEWNEVETKISDFLALFAHPT
jgi:menaquinone-specific isochorismate synthase